MFKKVLLLAPHLDDIELSCGGTVAKLVEEGARVSYIGFYCPKERIDELAHSIKILGLDAGNVLGYEFEHRTFPDHRQEILQLLYNQNKAHQPDLVLTPSTTDIHQDHQVVTNEAIRAFRKSTILGYEVPGNNIEMHKECFVPLKEWHVQKKVDAVMCYTSQFSARGDRFNKDYIRGVTISNGSYIRTKYAEAFEVIKLIL